MHHVNPFWFGAGGGGPTDPFWANVTGLWHFDETAGSTTYVDSSSVSHNLVDQVGTQTSSAQSVFGGMSLRIASGNNRANTVSSNDYNFGAGDFTFEFRFRADAIALKNIIDFRNTVDGNRPLLYSNANGSLVLYVNSLIKLTTAAGVITATTWHALAYDRVDVAGVFTGRLYVDGAVVGSWTDNTTYDNTTVPSVVVPSAGTAGYQSVYYDEMRVTKGTARYQGAYTPAVAAFPNS